MIDITVLDGTLARMLIQCAILVLALGIFIRQSQILSKLG